MKFFFSFSVGVVIAISLLGFNLSEVHASQRASKTFVDRWSSLLPRKPGAAYRRDQVVPYSHYYAEIGTNTDRPHGRSRNWADASPAVMAECADNLAAYLQARGLSQEDVAFGLSVCRLESGFNPDAASALSSSTGLSECIDATFEQWCKKLHIEVTDQFDCDAHAQCLAAIVEDVLHRAAKAKGRGNHDSFYAYAYGLYHDGPGSHPSAEALTLGREKIIPTMKTALQCLSDD